MGVDNLLDPNLNKIHCALIWRQLIKNSPLDNCHRDAEVRSEEESSKAPLRTALLAVLVLNCQPPLFTLTPLGQPSTENKKSAEKRKIKQDCV